MKVYNPGGSEEENGMCEGVIIVTIKLKPDASRDRFLELCREVRTWLARQPGFVRYELFEAGDGRWTDIMTWASVEEMEVGHEALGTSDLTNAFEDLVEPLHVSFVGKAVAL